VGGFVLTPALREQSLLSPIGHTRWVTPGDNEYRATERKTRLLEGFNDYAEGLIIPPCTVQHVPPFNCGFPAGRRFAVAENRVCEMVTIISVSGFIRHEAIFALLRVLTPAALTRIANPEKSKPIMTAWL